MVFEVIRSAIERRKTHKDWLARYDEALALLMAARTDPELRVAHQEMGEAVSAGQLGPGDIRGAQRRAMKALGERILEDGRVSLAEYQLLERRSQALGATRLSDWGINEEDVARCFQVSEIEAGRLPEMGIPDGVVIHDGETMHWGAQAWLFKRKLVKDRLHYGGITQSFKIAPHTRIRLGTFKIARTGSVHLVEEDGGLLLLTSQRLIYHGRMKRFDMKWGQITSMVLSDAGIEITKAGRENPFIFGLASEEAAVVPLTLLAALTSR